MVENQEELVPEAKRNRLTILSLILQLDDMTAAIATLSPYGEIMP